MTDANGDTVLRPRPIPAIMIFFTGLILLGIHLFNKKQSMDVFYISLGCFLLASVLFQIFRLNSITIGSQGLVVKNPLGTKEIQWRQISRTWITRVHRGKYRRFDWHFETTDQRKLRFSIKFYSRKSLQLLAQTLLSQSRSAVVDEKIRSLTGN